MQWTNVRWVEGARAVAGHGIAYKHAIWLRWLCCGSSALPPTHATGVTAEWLQTAQQGPSPWPAAAWVAIAEKGAAGARRHLFHP